MKLIVNEGVCTGCHCCELACSARNIGQFFPGRARVRVTSCREDHGSHIAICTQCDDEFCVQGCPEEAIGRDPVDGVVKIDYERCTRCLACVEDCPYGAMFVDPITSQPLKCDLCAGDPECVQFCRPQALVFV